MIHRMNVNIGEEFSAPQELTFGWQDLRKSFSVWYRADDDDSNLIAYIVLPTGQESIRPITRIVATALLPDGFHAFHLCELKPKDSTK